MPTPSKGKEGVRTRPSNPTLFVLFLGEAERHHIPARMLEAMVRMFCCMERSPAMVDSPARERTRVISPMCVLLSLHGRRTG